MTPELRRASERALQVVTAEGRVLSGGRAALFVLEHLGWRVPARLLSHPPLVPLVEAAYRLAARYRGLLGRLLR